MAFKEIKRENTGNGQYISTFLVDLITDIEELPTEVTVGSRALCIEDKKTYLFTPQEEWRESIGERIWQ